MTINEKITALMRAAMDKYTGIQGSILEWSGKLFEEVFSELSSMDE